ncbi:MAG: hypothetical protein C7B44_09325 [Sulfobacillus thermosulfidooxidans]|uniref:ACT domain-containing protein n=1 Tax=Sulfobacillus thermotolerans TaxID=338644 RepID=A0ABN5H0C6_9FIRM|nr:hypothetical protein [Sulfobacillus sp. hq2]AUW94197.1 hypothetical protein BXT84_09760 [Sulfobacillus thermotolerans]MCY0907581.1 hypothetical protein [Sulfobacillus thermotolerans]POB09535.1 hypothetical protein CO251_15025 [Sulfobacillus sp. hq2]PSR36382.1 MAG: hypothetical protein C7B44_09325 [Sulfobacillus thermosulfidooxidans]
MNPFIGVEMQDKPGAIQRLLLLLGQRNVEIEQMTIKKDREAGRLTAMIGIDATAEKARWVMRQLTRHQDIVRTFLAKNSFHTVLVAAGPKDSAVRDVPAVSCSPIDAHAGYYTVAGPRHAVDTWIEENHARVFALFPSCLSGKINDKHARTQTHHIQGGWNHERKIILRRQRRSEVVSR